MKSIVFLAFLLAAAMPCFSQPSLDGNYSLPVDHVWGVPGDMRLQTVYDAYSISIRGLAYRGYYYMPSYRIGWQDEWLKTQYHTYNALYSIKDATLGKDGYWYFDHGYSERAEPMLFIIGGDTYIAFNKSDLSKPDEIDHEISDFLWLHEGTYNKIMDGTIQIGKDGWGEFSPGLWDDGIESIHTWSTLTESVKGTEVTYGAERMRYPFSSACDSDINFNNFTLFWAEGEEGSGIGGTIELAFNRPADHLMVLNGAVDLSRLNLYKDNNRLRRVLVVANDRSFAFEYEFEDWVAFHKIPFPSEATGVTLTILSVYPGRRWDDTCVSAMFLKQRPLRPVVEYQAILETCIRLNGIDKMIEDYEREMGGPDVYASSDWGTGSGIGLADTQRIHR